MFTLVTGEGSCVTGDNTGYLLLMERDADGAVAEPLSKPTGLNNKPEGVDAMNINPNLENTTCKGEEEELTADHVVFVADYCNSYIHVFTVDTDLGTLTHRAAVDISATVIETELECHPSSVRYEPYTNVVVVLCQTRGTILNLTFDPDDQCALTYDPDTEVLLGHVDGLGLPTCTNTPTLDDCNQTCKPHTIDFDHDLYPGWLFVSLTQKGEIVAVRADAYADQAAVVRALSSRNFEPRAHAVVGE